VRPGYRTPFWPRATIQALSGAADRGENIIYCCFDNEAYMNTGIQVSSSTPQLAWTMTTPSGKQTSKKNMVEIMGAHKIAYSAAASACHPDDLRQKVHRAKEMRGLKYIHILSPCPTGWRFPERLTPNVGRLAVETKFYPLYEIIDGREYFVTHEPLNLPVKEYLTSQRRFEHLSPEETAAVQAEVDRNWEELRARARVRRP